MPDTSPISVTTAAQRLDLLITGAPDVKNKYGSGTIRPSEVTLAYSDGSIVAQLYGSWRREDGELTDAAASQRYPTHMGEMEGWPEWLATLAREHAPAAVPSAPADQTALRDRIAEVLWPLTDWDGDQLNAERAADAVLAVLPEPADRPAILREAADVAENYLARFPDMEDIKAEGIIGPHTMAAAIATELRSRADEAQQPIQEA